MLYSCWGDEEVIFALERAESNAKKVGKKNAVCPSVFITFRMAFVMNVHRTMQVFICLNCEESRPVESIRDWLAQPKILQKARKAKSAKKKKMLAKKKQEKKEEATATSTAITRSETLESWLVNEGQSMMEASVDQIKKAYEIWLTEGMDKTSKVAKNPKKKKTTKPVKLLPKTSALHLRLAARDSYYDMKNYPLFIVFDEVMFHSYRS